MPIAQINTNDLKKLVYKAVEDAFDRRMIELRLSLLPYVSEEEQREIEALYGKEPGPEDVAFTEKIAI